MNGGEFIKRRRDIWIAGLAMVLLAPLAALWAEDPAAAPAAGAVRLSSVEGQVQIIQDNQVLADPGLVNTPLFEGTQVVTGEDGRAELQFDDGTVVRLSPNCSLTLISLTGNSSDLRLESGLGYFVMQGSGSQVRVRFADAVVTGSGFTVVRIKLDTTPGEVAVFSGNAHLERGSGLALDLHGGESVALNRADPSQYNLAESIEPDSWDAWNNDLDQAETSAAASRTNAASNLSINNSPAWNDLDQNGNWYNVPGQGYVWSPYGANGSGWDPYGNGHWMWMPRYGYIWVSGDPWGYLPFQCGGWSYYDTFGWGWMPRGCNPWWNGGMWFSTVYDGPSHYRPPRRPRPGPPRPPGLPLTGTGHRPTPFPIIAIHNRPPGVVKGEPVLGKNTPVTIAGQTVLPLRPISQRMQYEHGGGGAAGGSSYGGMHQPAVGGTSLRTPGTAGSTPTPVYQGTRPVMPVYRPVQPSGGGSTHTPAPSHPSSGAPHSFGGGGGSSTPRPSGGGGGGGGGGSAPHVSSGGGGGGGGSHSGGGTHK